MRPRKVVLLFCADEKERSVRSCILGTKRYNVVGGISSMAPVPDVVLIVDDSTLETVWAAQSIARLLPRVPMLVETNPKRSTLPIDTYPGTAQLMPVESRPLDLFEQLRWAVMRKRGPKTPHPTWATA